MISVLVFVGYVFVSWFLLPSLVLKREWWLCVACRKFFWAPDMCSYKGLPSHWKLTLRNRDGLGESGDHPTGGRKVGVPPRSA